MDLVSQIFSLMGIFGLLQSMVPPKLRGVCDDLLEKFWAWVFGSNSPDLAYVEVPSEGQGGYRSSNPLYPQVQLYLGSLHASLLSRNQRLNAYRSGDGDALVYTLSDGETLEDEFRGVTMTWTYSCRRDSNGESKVQQSSEEKRSFTLSMPKGHRTALLAPYLEHIGATAKDIERRNSQRFLYTNEYNNWREVPFNHPSTFETLALPTDLNDRIMADLRAFSTGEHFYHRAGRAWKRGYLLYGPPGTGKSSLIAAMANFLHYDIYDLELTKVESNSELRSLLIETTRKSLIIIEDIDCTIDLSNRDAKHTNMEASNDNNDNGDNNINNINNNNSNNNDWDVEKKQAGVTLSGMLNFTDGLWSCCGEERIFVFTTNHKDRLDPALLRSGRMDFHILLSYCTFPAFKILASNYLDIPNDHPLMPEVEKAMKGEHHVTPADIAEILICNRENGDPDKAIRDVINALARATTTMQDNGEDKGDDGSMKNVQNNVQNIARRRGWKKVHQSLFFLIALLYRGIPLPPKSLVQYKIIQQA